MEHLGTFLAFFLVCGFTMTWNPNDAKAAALAPTPISNTPRSMLEYPSHSYLSYEEDAIYSMLRTWNNSGTNVSALMPSWSSSNRIHPCNSTAFLRVSRQWITCSGQLVHIMNLTSYDYKLTCMSIVGPNYGGSVAIVGEVPTTISNLTNLQELTIVGHPKLSGPLPIDILNKALPSITSISFHGCNLSGSITLSTDSPQLVQLATLDLSSNSFTGSAPFCQNTKQYALSSFNQSILLESIDISNNQFTDVIIREDAFLLQFMYAQCNLLQRFPSQLLNLPQLQEIYLDSNKISGVLTLPNIFASNSSLHLISLLNNNITDLSPSNESSSLLSEANLRTSELLFLGGNPICEDSRKNAMMRMVCRFNRSSPIDDTHNGLDKTAITISISVGAVVMIALIVTLFVIKKLRKKIAIMRDFQNELDKKDIKPNLYSYTELKAATQDFHPNNELGRGGFGIVYKMGPKWLSNDYSK